MSARYEILVNGQRHCLCGLNGQGVLSINVSYVDSDKNQQPHHMTPGALGHFDDNIEEHHHAQWPSLELQEGDEITIRILQPGIFDPPAHIFSS